MKSRITPKQTLLEEQFNYYLAVKRRELKLYGLCHGFSLVFAEMHKMGKLDWWQDVLDALGAWDRNPDTLALPHNIPDSFDPAETLGELFERALYYVHFYSGKHHYSDGLSIPEQQCLSKRTTETQAMSVVFTLPHRQASATLDAVHEEASVLNDLSNCRNFSRDAVFASNGGYYTEEGNIVYHQVVTIVSDTHMGSYNSSSGVFYCNEKATDWAGCVAIAEHIDFASTFTVNNSVSIICTTKQDKKELEKVIREAHRLAYAQNDLAYLIEANLGYPFTLRFLFQLSDKLGFNKRELNKHRQVRGYRYHYERTEAIDEYIPECMHSFLDGEEELDEPALLIVQNAIQVERYKARLITDIIHFFPRFFMHLFQAATIHPALIEDLLTEIDKNENRMMVIAQLTDLERRTSFLRTLLAMSSCSERAYRLYEKLTSQLHIAPHHSTLLLIHFVNDEVTAGRGNRLNEKLTQLYLAKLFSSKQASLLSEALNSKQLVGFIVTQIDRRYFRYLTYWKKLVALAKASPEILGQLEGLQLTNPTVKLHLCLFQAAPRYPSLVSKLMKGDDNVKATAAAIIASYPDMENVTDFLRALLAMSLATNEAYIFYKTLLIPFQKRTHQPVLLHIEFVEEAVASGRGAALSPVIITDYLTWLFAAENASHMSEALLNKSTVCFIVTQIDRQYYYHSTFWEEFITLVKDKPAVLNHLEGLALRTPIVKLQLALLRNECELAITIFQASASSLRCSVSMLLKQHPSFALVAFRLADRHLAIRVELLNHLNANPELAISTLDATEASNEKVAFVHYLLTSSSTILQCKIYSHLIMDEEFTLSLIAKSSLAQRCNLLTGLLSRSSSHLSHRHLIAHLLTQIAEQNSTHFATYLNDLLRIKSPHGGRANSLPGYLVLVKHALEHHAHHPYLVSALLQQKPDSVTLILEELPFEIVRAVLSLGEQAYAACSTDQLLQLLNRLKAAPTDRTNLFCLALCKERSRPGYGRTNTWQAAVKSVQATLRLKCQLEGRQGAKVTEALQFNTSRLAFSLFSRSEQQPMFTIRGIAAHVLTTQSPEAAFIMLTKSHTVERPVFAEAIELLLDTEKEQPESYDVAYEHLQEKTSEVVVVLLDRDITLFEPLFNFAEENAHPIACELIHYFSNIDNLNRLLDAVDSEVEEAASTVINLICMLPSEARVAIEKLSEFTAAHHLHDQLIKQASDSEEIVEAIEAHTPAKEFMSAVTASCSPIISTP